jgi:hypothetical protein
MSRKKRHKAESHAERPLEERAYSPRITTHPLTLSVALVFALAAAGAFLPEARLWGINHLNFYSIPVRAAVLALLAATFVPAVNRRLYAGMLRMSREIKAGGGRVDLMVTVVAVASVLLFWTFRASTNLLGDGQLIAQSFEAAWAGHDKVIMRSVGAIVTEERIAPGATLAYYAAARAITAVTGNGPVWGIRLFVGCLGALLVFLVLRFARKGPFSPEVRLWLLVLALFATTLQLFFGYIENYAPLVFVGFLYVVVGLLVLHDDSPLWLAIVLFLLTVYTHIQAVLFGASLLYLIMWRSMKNRRERVERYAGPALTLLTVVVALAAGLTPVRQYYLPLRGGERFYGMFSAAHAADFLNEILMLMPILPLFVVMAWINKMLVRRAGAAREKTGAGAATTGWFAMTAEWHFALLLLVPCILYMFLFKPEIGMARDWDLFTMSMLGLVPLALLIINRYFRTTKMQLGAAAFTVPAVAIYVALMAAWVGINASPGRSAERFEHILEYDKTHASYAYENLAIFYHDNGNLKKAMEIMENTYKASNNPRQALRLAMYYKEAHRKEDAIDLMRRTLREHPENHKIRFYLISLIDNGDNLDELWAVARDGTRYHPEEAIYWFYYGEVSITKGRIEEGVNALRKCLELNPPSEARARCIEQLKEHSGQQE